MSTSIFDKKGPFYFIPDWDDLVDPHFDFLTDTPGSKGWQDGKYCHELITPPPYDGLLVSKVVEEKSKMRKERMRRLGVHGALRVSPEFPIIGDCGAFGYIMDEVPPYTSEEIIDYYSTGGFDFGVSIDHLIPSFDHPQKEFRYDITLKNAKEFINLHKKQNLPWIPMGAVQGWSPETYGEAAAKMAGMGYKILAIGGLVRSSTDIIISVIKEVNKSIPKGVKLHLFGVARTKLLPSLIEHDIFSVDSASVLRRAWLGSTDNYHTLNHDYCAIRIPVPGKRGSMKNLTGKELNRAIKSEQKALLDLRNYDKGKLSIDKVMKTLLDYEKIHSEGKKSRMAHVEKTLIDKPWQKCNCPICKEIGVEVVIFRGNNRNRRRGFHNTHNLQKRFNALRSVNNI
jgi:Queuine tRNA-ribosyltransferase